MFDDRTIVSLLFDRDERALSAGREKYENYISSILRSVLSSREDVDECMDDVLLAMWNSIPPNRPDSLKGYLATIARNIAIDRYSSNNAQKRGRGTERLLDEVDDFTPHGTPENELIAAELQKEINEFLASQEKESRICFVLRYYHAMSCKDIAKKTGKTESAVSSLLYKLRTRLREHLVSRGYDC